MMELERTEISQRLFQSATATNLLTNSSILQTFLSILT